MNAARLLAFAKVGRAHNAPRIFLESHRLAALGFPIGQPVRVEQTVGGVSLHAATDGATHTVSSRRAAGGRRPVLDVNSYRALGALDGYEEAKLSASAGIIRVRPSVRAFAIARARAAKAPFRTLDLFCGGGTLSAAVAHSPLFTVVAGVERDPSFADCWQASHPNALLVQGDIRMMSPLELPRSDLLLAGIPCSDHSPLGRAKKGLAGIRAEAEGNYADLFVHVAAIAQAQMPAAICLENVPSFATSSAGLTLINNLRQLGYQVQELTLQPFKEWGEPSPRQRWVCVATLEPGFRIQIPNIAFNGRAADFFDSPDPAMDRADAERIAGTIAGLRAHNARHAALGHGFGFTVLDGTEDRIPTLVKSYHKINAGPFVATPFGPRLLRQAEMERIMGCRVATDHFATACQILGQGVQTRVFGRILDQLGTFLSGERAAAPEPTLLSLPLVWRGESQLELQIRECENASDQALTPSW